jgi:hypothetical protein
MPLKQKELCQQSMTPAKAGVFILENRTFFLWRKMLRHDIIIFDKI